MRTPALIFSAVLVSACGAQLKPETLVERLRVLSITATPPEVKPGQTAALDVLQVDPSGAKTTVVWVGCDPDPFGLGRSACNDTSALLQPTSFTTFPEGVRILGIGNKSSYAAPASLFDPIEMGDSNRFNGVVGQVLAVVIGEEIDPTSTNEELRELFGRIEKQEVKSVYALTRITVSEKPAQQNVNPHLDGLSVDGVALPKNGTIQVKAGQELALRVTAGDAETYPLQLPTGMEMRTESLVAAWYSTNGRFSPERMPLEGQEDTYFIAPGAPDLPEDPVPQRRFGTIWVVIRDSRGGQAFSPQPFFVCDETLPEPKPTSVTAPSSSTDPVSVKGMDMSSALDVVVGGIALRRGFYSPAQNAFLGDLPPELQPGTYAVSVRTKRCTTVETQLMLTVP